MTTYDKYLSYAAKSEQRKGHLKDLSQQYNRQVKEKAELNDVISLYRDCKNLEELG